MLRSIFANILTLPHLRTSIIRAHTFNIYLMDIPIGASRSLVKVITSHRRFLARHKIYPDRDSVQVIVQKLKNSVLKGGRAPSANYLSSVLQTLKRLYPDKFAQVRLKQITDAPANRQFQIPGKYAAQLSALVQYSVGVDLKSGLLQHPNRALYDTMIAILVIVATAITLRRLEFLRVDAISESENSRSIRMEKGPPVPVIEAFWPRIRSRVLLLINARNELPNSEFFDKAAVITCSSDALNKSLRLLYALVNGEAAPFQFGLNRFVQFKARDVLMRNVVVSAEGGVDARDLSEEVTDAMDISQRELYEELDFAWSSERYNTS